MTRWQALPWIALWSVLGAACSPDFHVGERQPDAGSAGGAGGAMGSGGGGGGAAGGGPLGGAGGMGGAGGTGGAGGGSDCLPCDCNCDGVCDDTVPVNLVSPGPSFARGIALSATHVYWTDFMSGTVTGVSKAGGSLISIASGEAAPQYLTVFGGEVFWGNVNDGRVRRAPAMGGGSPVNVSTDELEPTGISSYGSGVCWANQGNSEIRKSIANVVSTVTADGGMEPYAIVCDATNAYWVDRTGGAVRRASLTVVGPAQDLVTVGSTTSPRSIALQGNHVYWTENTPNGRVLRVPISGGTAEMLGTSPLPHEIAADATHVYWTDSGDARIRRATLSGTMPTIFANPGGSPAGIALDAKCAYWVEAGPQGGIKAKRK